MKLREALLNSPMERLPFSVFRHAFLVAIVATNFFQAGRFPDAQGSAEVASNRYVSGELMLTGVFRPRKNLKIFRAIVGANPVLVVDNLASLEGPTEGEFHDDAVLCAVSVWTNQDVNIPVPCRPSSAPPRIIPAVLISHAWNSNVYGTKRQ